MLSVVTYLICNFDMRKSIKASIVEINFTEKSGNVIDKLISKSKSPNIELKTTEFDTNQINNLIKNQRIIIHFFVKVNR